MTTACLEATFPQQSYVAPRVSQFGLLVVGGNYFTAEYIPLPHYSRVSTALLVLLEK